jgi:hypothetical protein
MARDCGKTLLVLDTVTGRQRPSACTSAWAGSAWA